MILSISWVTGCSLYITCCGRVFTLLSFGLGGRGKQSEGKAGPDGRFHPLHHK